MCSLLVRRCLSAPSRRQRIIAIDLGHGQVSGQPEVRLREPWISGQPVRSGGLACQWGVGPFNGARRALTTVLAASDLICQWPDLTHLPRLTLATMAGGVHRGTLRLYVHWR